MFKAIQKSKAKKGFTLVELIVVIAIIAILMLVLVPSLLAYINKANKSKAESNAKMVYDAALSAYTELAAKDASTINESAIVSVIQVDQTLKDVNFNLHCATGGEVDYVMWGKTSTSDANNTTDVNKGNAAVWPTTTSLTGAFAASYSGNATTTP